MTDTPTTATPAPSPHRVAVGGAASDITDIVARHVAMLIHLGRAGDAAHLAGAWLAGAPDHPPIRLLLAQALYEAGEAAVARAVLAPLPADLPGRAALCRAVALATGDLTAAASPPPGNRRSRQPERILAGDDLGETIAFARFLPALAAKETPIIAEVPDALVPVLAGLGGSVTWLPRAEGSEPGRGLEAVPSRLAVPFDRLAAAAAPLTPDRTRTAAWARRVGQDGYRVGIAWHADTDPLASLPVADLAPLAHLVGVRLVSVQTGRAASALHAERGLAGLVDRGLDLAAGPGQLVDLTALLAALDAVVTADNVVAHLAAALGKPVALLARAPGAGWLWPPGRDTSPLYATLRIFRQRHPDDWSGAIAAALDWLQHRRGGTGPTAPIGVPGPRLIPAALPVGSYINRLADIAARLAGTEDARQRSSLIAEQLSLRAGWQRLGLDPRPIAALLAAAEDLALRRREVLARLATLEAARDHGPAFVAAARLLVLLERERDALAAAIDALGTRRQRDTDGAVAPSAASAASDRQTLTSRSMA